MFVLTNKNGIKTCINNMIDVSLQAETAHLSNNQAEGAA